MRDLSPEAHKEAARRALEVVCTGDLDSAAEVYSPTFADHVNSADFQGLDGVRQSVSAYRQLFPDLEVTVDDQVAEGDRVASRWTMRGTHDGRDVSFSGITISRFVDGRIEEDWTFFDSAELARQLGGA